MLRASSMVKYLFGKRVLASTANSSLLCVFNISLYLSKVYGLKSSLLLPVFMNAVETLKLANLSAALLTDPGPVTSNSGSILLTALIISIGVSSSSILASSKFSKSNLASSGRPISTALRLSLLVALCASSCSLICSTISGPLFVKSKLVPLYLVANFLKSSILRLATFSSIKN